ncbi:3-oxoacyl-ACP synthase [Christiangramia fulva]|uniref:3-oxoacyl-ACP synthase n=1 Tax=Christiangramia fulva TaxID=2126553 RepID=A0A2R3Z808_9FLAO|nr:beta-ketoacyl synthase chain length factor [Christiangramia fulva]AVR46416.1 3-oxoacyl-ACP synthase [Christiangramia fulva]
MGRLFINAIAAISPQPEDVFEGASIIEYHQNILPALDQEYKAFIKPMLLRRMSKAVKMGLVCSKKVLEEVKIEKPDAIIVGTGQGCMQETEKFLEQILDSNEELLSPTSFIQSTHNTVAGQIALSLKCFGYNMTFTQNSASFESALADALILAEDENFQNLLVGGVEEIAETSTSFQYYDHQLKQQQIKNTDLFKENSEGTITSEAAAFFLLGNSASPNTYAAIKDVKIFNSVDPEKIDRKIKDFILENELSEDDIDLVLLGKNGDSRYDGYYSGVENLFSEKLQLAYKHLAGDNHTISSYGLWLASKILKTGKIPEILKLNSAKCNSPRNILLYNQYLGRNHGLILLQSIDL